MEPLHDLRSETPTTSSTQPAARRLIVNADDFGLSPGVNAGIALAHRRGLLTSATLMANSPFFPEAADIALANPGLGVGVHLNLVRGSPLSPPEEVPLLVDAAGRLRPFRFRRFSPTFLAQAELEYRRQIARVIGAGIAPDHIDFEKHHAWRAPLYDLACRLASEAGIAAVRTLREPVIWSLRHLGWPGLRKAGMAAALRCGVELFGSRRRLASPDRLLGQTHIGTMAEEAWLRLIRHLPPGISEVMTHPGLAEPGGGGASPEMGASWLAGAREGELAALLSGGVRRAAEAAGVELVRFGDVLGRESCCVEGN